MAPLKQMWLRHEAETLQTRISYPTRTPIFCNKTVVGLSNRASGFFMPQFYLSTCSLFNCRVNKTAISGTIDLPAKVQRNPGNAYAIRCSSATRLIASISFPWSREWRAFGMGFWITLPSMYSLTGFISGSAKNSSSFTDVGFATVMFF